MKIHNKSLMIAVLSLSLLTVMAGAAVSPALGGMAIYFRDADPLLIKMILTIPALFTLVTNLLFARVAKRFSNRTLSLAALILYMAGGCLGGVVDHIGPLLFFRAVLGISIGILMPLSTSLIGYYYERDQQEKLMGYATAMNQLGGVIVILLSGFLVSISWRCSFLVYAIGLISFVLTCLFMPNEKMERIEKEVEIYDTLEAEIAGIHARAAKEKKAVPADSAFAPGADGINAEGRSRFRIYYLAMCFVMITFYIFPTNYAVIVTAEQSFTPVMIGILMAVQTGSSLIISVVYGSIKKLFGGAVKFVSAAGFIAGFSLLYFFSGFPVNLGATILIGVGLGIATPMLNAEVSKRARPSETTKTLGIMSASLFLGMFLAPLFSAIMTILFHMHEIRAPFFQAAFFGVILLIIYSRMEIEHKKNSAETGK